MTEPFRFYTFIDDEHSFFVIRPIGELPGPEHAARVIAFYRSLDRPWRYNRLIDFRRHAAYVSDADRGAIAEAWAEITRGVDYHARVAIVARDAWEKLRLPQMAQDFPNETICFFSDYHEAAGWLQAQAPDAYLAALRKVVAPRRDDDDIEGI